MALRTTGRGLAGLGVLLALAGGLRGARVLAARLADVTAVPAALTASEHELLRADLDALRPGTGALWEACLRELPEDALVLGLHPTADDEATDPALTGERAASLAVLGRLQLLLYPREVHSAGSLGLTPGPGWRPPSGIPPERAFLLDLAFPHPEHLALWRPLASTPGGRLLALETAP